jgi:tetratricopeptide (TPR) repeat protein
MALLRPNLLKLLAPALAFVAALVVLGLGGGSRAPSLSRAPDAGGLRPGLSTDARIASLQQTILAAPGDAEPYGMLGDAYLQKVRETGDPAYYPKAQAVFESALRRGPGDLTATIGMGTLALARHDFGAGLRYGLEAHRLAPDLVRPYAVIVDAQVELGRYDEAAASLQRMVDMKPNLASYSRVSYQRELHGDLAGAVEAMRLAVSAGGGAPENVAYVQTLLGNLYFELGRYGAARDAYRLAVARFPSYLPAAAGLARVDAARGDLAVAIRRYRSVVDRLPLPEHVVALGEAELAAGRRAAAGRDLELVRAEERLLRAAGVNTDVEVALFEASHGDPGRAAALAKRAYAAAPSIRSADALGWALTRAGRPTAGLRWARRALALGSRDRLFLYHAGMSARAAGRRHQARRYLARALEHGKGFSPLYAPRATRALEELR